jgi:26S proteasome regulatory subunit N6
MAAMASTSTQSALDQALALQDPAQRQRALADILKHPAGQSPLPRDSIPQLTPEYTGPRDEDLLKQQEQAIVKLAELYRDQKDADALADILRQSRTLVVNLAKAKTAKLSQ